MNVKTRCHSTLYSSAERLYLAQSGISWETSLVLLSASAKSFSMPVRTLFQCSVRGCRCGCGLSIYLMPGRMMSCRILKGAMVGSACSTAQKTYKAHDLMQLSQVIYVLFSQVSEVSNTCPSPFVLSRYSTEIQSYQHDISHLFTIQVSSYLNHYA
jgi:hypothetical protein